MHSGKKINIKILSYKINKGKGGAVRYVKYYQKIH